MGSRTRWWGPAALVAAALWGALLITSCAGPRASERTAAAGGPKHPDVDAGLDTCFGYHAQVTPEVAAQWRDSRHGLSLVECLVCHGSTGADFKARPQPAGCGGCHPAQAASAPSGESPGCFACHPSHALRAAPGKDMPHPPKPKEASR